MSAGIALLPGVERNPWPDSAFDEWCRGWLHAAVLALALTLGFLACASRRSDLAMLPSPTSVPDAPVSFEVGLGEPVGEPIGQPLGERMVWVCDTESRECDLEDARQRLAAAPHRSGIVQRQDVGF